ncbi:MSHA biogenesis protein MshP [Vibrio hippocampi]|uniref:MSHA biogenesis protein MshP n=1 Tax=Vibrio hippocampi TaxID=654686 RepID=A0ABM8ZKX8_9VIBR|nr:MSHA biogenesis protein MshP [Vibrio hippocampi]CAH0526865.1 hypothetical protein VHP8226_02241 [Vibrio hippocampi]
MSHKLFRQQNCFGQKNCFGQQNHFRQRGNALIISIFILVVIGMMASGLTRIRWSNHDSHVRTLNGTQAWLYAQSASEEMLTKLYPLGSQSIDSDQCVASFTSSFSDSRCPIISSSCETLAELEGVKYYKVSSRAQCGQGLFLVERQHELWLKGE